MALVVVNRVDHNGKTYLKGDVLPESLVDQKEVDQHKYSDDDVKYLHDERKAALLERGAVVESNDPAKATMPEPTPAEVQASPNPEQIKAEGGQPLQQTPVEDTGETRAQDDDEEIEG